MNQYSDDNGCTCAAAGLQSGQCIACRARAKARTNCKDCRIGLYEGEEADRSQCSNCYWNNR